MDTLENIGARAKIASRLLAVAGTARKNEALTAMARALAAHSDDILAANRQDVAAAKAAGTTAVLNGLDESEIPQRFQAIRRELKSKP